MNEMMNVSHDIGTIMKLSRMITLLNFLKTTLTVGIIAFTVFRIMGIFKETN